MYLSQAGSTVQSTLEGETKAWTMACECHATPVFAAAVSLPQLSSLS